MAKKKKAEEVAAPEEVPVAEATPEAPVPVPKKAAKADVVEANGLTSHQNELVIVELPCPVTINGVQYSGRAKVARHMAECMQEMVQAKKRSDSKIGTGKNFIVHHLSNGDRIEQENNS